MSLNPDEFETHWGRMTHICVDNLTITGSDYGLSPARHQAILWTNAGILLIGPLGTKFSEVLIKIHTFSFKKMHLKMLSGKWQPFFLASMCLCSRFCHLFTPAGTCGKKMLNQSFIQYSEFIVIYRSHVHMAARQSHVSYMTWTCIIHDTYMIHCNTDCTALLTHWDLGDAYTRINAFSQCV